MSEVSLDRLPAELRFATAEQMGADATIQQWIRFEQRCSADKVDFAPLFTAWLRARDEDSTCCASAWDADEKSFVRRHIPGKALATPLDFTDVPTVLVATNVSVQVDLRWDSACAQQTPTWSMRTGNDVSPTPALLARPGRSAVGQRAVMKFSIRAPDRKPAVLYSGLCVDSFDAVFVDLLPCFLDKTWLCPREGARHVILHVGRWNQQRTDSHVVWKRFCPAQSLSATM